MSHKSSRKGRKMKYLLSVVAGLVAIFLLITGIGVMTGWSKTQGGEVDVVRNGGLFDNNAIRKVIQPNSNLTWTGLWSHDHKYTSASRNFKVSAENDSDSDEQIEVSTADGVHVGVDGTFYFSLNTDEKALKDFDNKFGTRTFPWGSGSKHAWEGDDGWKAMLRFTLNNVMKTIFREEVGKVKCEDLQPSCALAINPNARPGPADPNALADFTANIEKRFTDEARTVFGGDFFVKPTFALGTVKLPDNVKNAIDDAIAKRAQASGSQAELQKALIDAQTNEARQKGYNNCPTCAEIDKLHALPPGITTYAPGVPFAVTPGK
jgi:hypothetical protein